MEDLISWLRACLDDDEKTAKAATKGPWRADGTMVFIGDTDETVAAYSDYYMDDAYDGPEMSGLEAADAAHIARHDPAAVLADVAAKRAVLDLCVRAEIGDSGEMAQVYLAEEVISRLASAYRHRPGWRTEWE